MTQQPQTDGLGRRSAMGAAVTMGAQGVRLLIQFASQVVLARILLPAEFGVIAMVTPILGYLQGFSELGLLQVTVQRKDITDGEVSALFWVNAGLGAAFGIVLAAVSPLIGWFYGQPDAGHVALALSGLLVTASLSAQHVALLNRELRFVAIAAIDITGAVLAAAAGITAAMLGAGFWSLVAMQVANALTWLVLSWSFSGWRPSRPRRQPGLWPLLRFGAEVTGSGLVHNLSFSLDSVLIGVTAGQTALGYYDRAMRLVIQPIAQVVMPFGRVALPVLARLREDPERFRGAYSRLLQVSLALTTPAVVFAAVLAHPLVTTLLGDRWAPSAPILSWLAVGVLTGPVSNSAGWLFVLLDRTREQFRYTSVNSVIMVAAYAIGLPWGPLGVAKAGAVAVICLQGPLIWRAATRTGPVRLGDLLRSMGISLAAAAASGAVLLLPTVQRWVNVHGILGLLFGLAAAYGAYGAVLLCFPVGRDLVREGWRMRPRGQAAAATG